MTIPTIFSMTHLSKRARIWWRIFDIPLLKLARQVIPTSVYQEIPLFEDELGDNGIKNCWNDCEIWYMRSESNESRYLCWSKRSLNHSIVDIPTIYRVNETSFFVLSRFFLRIDHILFRIFDVRIYHEFGSQEIIRETKGRQAKYQALKEVCPFFEFLIWVFPNCWLSPETTDW